jgi:cobalt-zinc-cadmium efflux system protein
MKSIFPSIRDGHFSWCAGADAGHQGCFDCRSRSYLFAFGFSLLLSSAELYGGMRTQSLGLLSDAFHVLFDALGYLIGFAAARHGMKVADDHARFHDVQSRYEALMGLFLSVATFFIFKEAYQRIAAGEPPEIIEVGLLFWIALAGLAGNLAVLWMFRSFRVRDRILRANIWHTFGDTVSSVFVVANAALFAFAADPVWHYLDIAASVFIASLLLWQAVGLLTGTGHTHEH